MHALELKMPPPILGMLIAAAMWGASLVAPWPLGDGPPARGATVVGTVIAALGLAIGISGAVALRRSGTTVNPIKPERVSAFVEGGAFRFTRNPMYLGVAVLLVGWAVCLFSAAALLGPAVFVLYIDRFQIVPEERVLAQRFGATYLAYKARVRRWL